MELQNRLKDLREDEDKSQTEVANYLSIHQMCFRRFRFCPLALALQYNIKMSDKSQHLFSKKSHLFTPSTLSKYEKGTTDIPTSILCKLADYYRTSTDYILMRTYEKRPYKK